MNGEKTPDRFFNVELLIDERCDAFESAWRGGERPSIAEFLQEADSPLRARLFCELLLVELEFRRALGEEPGRDEYLDRFPDFAAQVESTSFRYGASAFIESPTEKNGIPSSVKYKCGTRIGRYQLVRWLGSGAMGEAWQALDTLLGRSVTIKLPHGDLLNENDWCRFKREAEIAAQLSHPSIASVLTLERENDRFYLVATYVEGTNLKEYANSNQLTFKEIAELCAAMCDALQYAHEKGVVHRDLKPANIIIDPEGRPHVIDFGLAKIASAANALTVDGELLGTIAYMSPELAAGKGAHANFKTDIYSLGAILYQLLTGHCLFTGDRNSVLAQILSTQPVRARAIRPVVPADLETICHKAIEKLPSDRYVSAAEMAKDLRRYVGGLPIHACPVGPIHRASRWIRRHPAIAASCVVTATVIVVVSVIISTLYNQNQRLAGFRPVHITTTPSGAQIAIVPLDPNTNEPYPSLVGILRPGTTPVTVQLKPGGYVVEAVLQDGARSTFVDVYRTVAETMQVPANVARANVDAGFDPQACRFPDIKVSGTDKDTEKMVLLDIPDDIRSRNPLIPEKLYVDIDQTTAAELKSRPGFAGSVATTADGNSCITYSRAIAWAERTQKRVPSSAEYDAIVATVKRLVKPNSKSELSRIVNLFDDMPEWTTTIKQLSNVGGKAAAVQLSQMHLLKAYGTVAEMPDVLLWVDGTLLADTNARSPKLSIRGVRSATPRYVTP